MARARWKGEQWASGHVLGPKAQGIARTRLIKRFPGVYRRYYQEAIDELRRQGAKEREEISAEVLDSRDVAS